MKSSTQLRRQLFISLGLSDKESILYETLLKYGTLPAATLEKYSGLKKNTYTILKSLERRSLVHKFIKDSRSHYQVGSPTQLQSYLLDKKHEVDEAMTLYNDTLPSLISDYKKVLDTPIVSHYQGLTGLRSVFDEVYKAGKKEILGCVGNEAPDPVFYEEIINKYRPLRISNNILARGISPDSKRARELKESESNDLKKKYLINPKKYPMPAEIETWNDSIAMMSFAKGDFHAILINHPELAKTLQSLLKLAMDLIASGAKSPSSPRSNPGHD